MSLKDQKFEIKYRTRTESKPQEFIIKCLANSRNWRSTTGYFSSIFLDFFREEVISFIENGGMIEILCNQHLTLDDIESIEKGYSLRKIYLHKIDAEIDAFIKNPNKDQEVSFVATLIKMGKLDIKIAFAPDPHIYHEKVGYFRDVDGDSIVYTGSSNNSFAGFADTGNTESFSVYKSWIPETMNYWKQHFDDINDTWEGRVAPGEEVIYFPDVPKNRLIKYAKDKLDKYNFSKIKSFREESEDYNISVEPRKNCKTDWSNLWDHQKSAIEDFAINNNRGLLRHATGSGKTITSIHILKEHNKRGLPALIVVPRELLQKQWYLEVQNEIEEANIIRCGGGYNDWMKRGVVKSSLNSSKAPIFIGIDKTVATHKFLNKFSGSMKDFLIIADEVHNLGSPTKRIIFEYDFNKRLGLSATPERSNDEVGTNLIIQYFENLLKPVYTIADAIKDGKLVKYEYHPEKVILTRDEEEKYLEFTKKINKLSPNLKNDDNLNSTKNIQILLSQRSKIIKKAHGKLKKSIEILSDNYHPGEHWLIYFDETNQIKAFSEEMRKYPNLPSPNIYTSNNIENRDSHIEHFRKNGGVLLSIGCLDEGVDIPEITHAIIVSSSTNERQYIQRRGRILRKSNGKSMSYLYDLFAVPTHSGKKFEKLLDNEITRAVEFSMNAINKSVASAILSQICIEYDIDQEQILKLDEE